MRDISEIHEAEKREKIEILESVSHAVEEATVKKIVSLLNDPDIEIRGEAFGALVLNRNDISGVLIGSLGDGEKNIRAFTALVLGNRKARNAVGPLRRLTGDQSATVRSCALGALGHLGAGEAEEEIRSCLADENIEVRRSALKAAIDTGCDISEQLPSLAGENDDELKKLAGIAERKRGGPEGI